MAPEAGLKVISALDADPRIAEHHRLAAVKAHLYEMIGEHDQAATYFRIAAERTRSILERDYLAAQAVRCKA